MILLDAAATMALRPQALAAMRPFLRAYVGNPSSAHAGGRRAAVALDWARAEVRRALDAPEHRVVFTSGGTEAANLAIQGVALASPRGRRLVTTPIEHPSVLETCRFLSRFLDFRVELLGVDRAGRVNPARVADACGARATLVALALANSEVGTLQPVADVAEAAHAAGSPVFVDAVQAAGHVPFSARGLGADLLGIAAHKFGGPAGAGALLVGPDVALEPLLHGGGQQQGLRSGTPDVAGAVGLAAALAAATRGIGARAARTAAERDRFVARVLAEVRPRLPGARLTGDPHRRIPGHASFVFPGLAGETILVGLEQRGILCSSSSACRAGDDAPSPALVAMGYDADVAMGAVRFSWGPDVSAAQLGAAARAVGEVVRDVAA